MTLFELMGVIKVDGRDATREIDKVENAAERGSKRTSGHFSAMGGALKAGILGAVAVGGAAVAAFTTKAVAVFGKFDAGMKEVFTLLPGMSKKAMSEMGQQAIQTARDIGRMPEEVVPALYQSLSAGVPKENVFGFIKIASKAADAGATDLTTSVNGITSAVNAYGAETLTAEQASDAMFTTVRLGKTTFAELSDSLFNVNPIASALGVSFTDVSAGMAAITLQGVPTNVAATQMRQLFIELSKEGGETASTFERIAGKSFKDFIASGGNVQDALKLMEGEAKRTGVGINDLFGSVEAGGAALALTGKGTAAFSNAISEMGKSAGATETAFQTMETSATEATDNLKVALATATLEVGQKLMPVWTSFAEWMTAQIPNISRVVMTAFDAIGVAIDYVRTNVIPPIQDAFRGTEAQGNTSFTALATIVKSTFDIISTAFYIGVGLWETVLKPSWSAIAPFMAGLFGGLAGIIQAFKLVLEGDFSGAWTAAVDSVESILTGLQSFLDTFFYGLWDVIKGPLTTLKDNVVNAALELKDGFVEKLTELRTAVWERVVDLWAYITQPITQFKFNFLNIALEIFNGVQGTFYDLRDKVAEVASNLWDGVKTHLTTFRDNFVSYLQDIPKRLKNLGKEIIDQITFGMTSRDKDVVNAAAKTAGYIPQTVETELGIRSPSKVLYALGAFATQGLAKGVEDPAEVAKLQGAAVNVGNTLATSLYNALGIGQPENDWVLAGRSVIQGFLDGMKAKWPEVTAFLDQVRNARPDVAVPIPGATGSATPSVGLPVPQLSGGAGHLVNVVIPQVTAALGQLATIAIPGVTVGLGQLSAISIPQVTAAGSAMYHAVLNNAALEADARRIMLDTQMAQQTAQMTWWQALLTNVGIGLSNAVTWVGTTLGGAVGWVGTTLTGAATWLSGMLTFSGDAWGQTVSWVGSVFAGAADFAWQAITGLGSGLLQLAGSQVPWLGATMDAMAGGPIAMLTAFLVSLIGETGAFSEMINGATEIVKPLIPILGDLFRAIWPIVEVLFGALKTGLSALSWIISNVVTPVFRVAAQIIAGIWNAFARAINAIFGWLGVNLPTVNVNASGSGSPGSHVPKAPGAPREYATPPTPPRNTYTPPKAPDKPKSSYNPSKPGGGSYKPPKPGAAPKPGGAPKPGSPKAPSSPGRGSSGGISTPGRGSSGGSGSGTDPGRGAGGTRVSEITGPTRDLLMDTFAPLMVLPELVGIGNRTFDLLNARLGGVPTIAAPAGGYGGIGSLTINMTASGNLDYDANDLARRIEPILFRRFQTSKRGTGR